MTTAIAIEEQQLHTRLVRLADGDGHEVRRGLRELRQRLEPKPQVYEVQKSARPAHAIVPLPLGQGNDPAVLQHALKSLRKAIDKCGLSAAMRRHEFWLKPSERKRMKRERARRGAAKVVRLEQRRGAMGGDLAHRIAGR